MQKQTPTWVIGDPLTAAKLNVVNADFDTIFKELSGENLAFTYDVSGRCTQIVDNENSITFQIDWSEFDVTTPNTPKLFIQKVGDPLKWTVTYSLTSGLPVSVVYA